MKWSEKATSEPDPNDDGAVTISEKWERSLLGRGNSMCKDPEVEK